MKANLKNILGLAALGMTLLTTAVPTWAGLVATQEVSISGNQVASWASGTMVGARYSADFNQFIGCKAQINNYYPWTSCSARDSAGRTLVCGSAENKFLEMVHGMTDSSSIYFQTDSTSSSGICTDIVITNSSHLLK
jgi:hypothetical protein